MNDKLNPDCPDGTYLYEGRFKSHLNRLRDGVKKTREELIKILLGIKRLMSSIAPKSTAIIGTKEDLEKLQTEELEILIAKVTSLIE